MSAKAESHEPGRKGPGAAKRLLFLLPVLVFLVIAGYLMWGLNPDRNIRAVPTALIDKPVPQFELPPIEGLDSGGLNTTDLTGQGEPVLLNVFASWCVPCRAEHPIITRLADDEGIPVYGLNYKDEAADARQWLDNLGNSYTKIGAMSEERAAVGIELGVYGVPETYLIDGEGRIRYKHVGPITASDLRETILPLIAELRG